MSRVVLIIDDDNLGDNLAELAECVSNAAMMGIREEMQATWAPTAMDSRIISNIRKIQQIKEKFFTSYKEYYVNFRHFWAQFSLFWCALLLEGSRRADCPILAPRSPPGS